MEQDNKEFEIELSLFKTALNNIDDLAAVMAFIVDNKGRAKFLAKGDPTDLQNMVVASMLGQAEFAQLIRNCLIRYEEEIVGMN